MNELPLTLEALGNISYAGTRACARERLERVGAGYLLDNQALWKRFPIDLNGRILTVWGRIPPFLRQAHLVEAFKAKLHFQIDSLPSSGAHFKLTNTKLLHTLVNTADKRAFELIPQHEPNVSELTPLDQDLVDKLNQIESDIINGDLDDSKLKISDLIANNINHARLWFAAGALNYREQKPKEAKQSFHLAQLMGHPDALEAEWAMVSCLSKPFRAAYPDTFFQIQNGERLRALTVLRQAKEQFPLHANATLAYCLRAANEPLEGIEACQTALLLDPYQSDVYGNLWSYLTELARDKEAFEIAKTHLSHYPTDLTALTNCLDSALLCSNYAEAYWYCQAYLIRAQNFNSALYNLFKYYEYQGDWPTLQFYFDFITPLMRGKTPQTLTLHGEVLVERGCFDKAFGVLDKALQAAPQDPNCVLSYARALARADRHDEAIQLLATAINDDRSSDDTGHHFLFLKLLSELFRYAGNLEEALKIWEEKGPFNHRLLHSVGPQPAVEYAYCLLESNRQQEARALYSSIQSVFPFENCTQQLGAVMGQSS